MNNEIHSPINETLPHPEISLERKESTATFHEAAYRLVDGPQGEGLRYEAALAALDDSRTITARVAIGDIEADAIVFSPIEYTNDHNADMLREKYEGSDVYYFPYASIIDYSQPAIEKAVDALPDNAVVLFEYREGNPVQAEVLRALLDDKVIEETFINSVNGKRASVTHYGGYLEPLRGDVVYDPEKSATAPLREAFEAGVASGKYERLPKDGTTIIGPEDLDRIVDGISIGDRMWSTYQERMVEWLVKEHPSLQVFDKEYYFEDLRNKNTLMIVDFTDEKPVCAMTLADVRDCFWLNQKDTRRALFCPGMVADNSSGQLGTSMNVLKFYFELEKEIGIGGYLATQCTEISAGYIPKIMELAIKKTNLDLKLPALAKYNYGAYEFTRAA